jgi:hypothetical protein
LKNVRSKIKTNCSNSSFEIKLIMVEISLMKLAINDLKILLWNRIILILNLFFFIFNIGKRKVRQLKVHISFHLACNPLRLCSRDRREREWNGRRNDGCGVSLSFVHPNQRWLILRKLNSVKRWKWGGFKFCTPKSEVADFKKIK